MWKDVGVHVHNLGRNVVDSGFCKGVHMKSFFPSLLFVRVWGGSKEIWISRPRRSSFCSFKCLNTAECAKQTKGIEWMHEPSCVLHQIQSNHAHLHFSSWHLNSISVWIAEHAAWWSIGGGIQTIPLRFGDKVRTCTPRWVSLLSWFGSAFQHFLLWEIWFSDGHVAN